MYHILYIYILYVLYIYVIYGFSLPNFFSGRLLPRCHGLAQDWGQEVEQHRLGKHHFQTWQSEMCY
jgi:hypothetical protein